MTEIYSKFVSAGDLVFDIGANIGLKTEIFLSLGCRVIAVEPHPECLRVLHHTCPEAFILPNAVSDVMDKPCRLYTGHDTRISSLSTPWIKAVGDSRRFGGYEWRDYVDVSAITLKSMVQRFGTPQFIKIDVEGSEAEVIRSLPWSVPALCFEFHSEFLSSTEECIRHLQTLGNPAFQYSLGETTELSGNLSSGSLLSELRNISKDSKVYGDIYARF